MVAFLHVLPILMCFLHYATFTAHLFFFLTATDTNSLEVLQNILFAGEFSSFFPH